MISLQVGLKNKLTEIRGINMQKVTCIDCLGTGIEHTEVYGNRFTQDCPTCKGTGYIVDIARLNKPIEKYKNEYVKWYNEYPGENKKEYELLNYNI